MRKLTKKQKKKLVQWGLLILIFYIVLSQPTKVGRKADVNLIGNEDMEIFCREDADGQSYTDDATHRKCAFSYSYYDDGEDPLVVGTTTHPYNWDLSYGCCMHLYQGTEPAYFGSKMLWLNKETYDDWYGFGYQDVPVQENKLYRAWVYAKKQKAEGDHRECSFAIRFYNSAGSKINIDVSTSSNLGVGGGDWAQVNATALAPAGAVRGGFQIWCPQNGNYEYLIDGQFFGEYRECNPGQTSACGTDTGVCSKGTMTCEADGTWGDCAGGVLPSSEVCNDGLDNNCNGNIDEWCDLEDDWQLSTWQAKFDKIDSDMHGGQGTSDTNSPTYWAWDNAPIVESYINMYTVTGQMKYLDSVVDNTDRLISKASDYNGDGYLDWEAHESPIDPILTYGRTIFPMIKFAYVVKKDNIGAYDAKANEYINFVVNNFVPVYDGRWGECHDAGSWLEGDHSAPNNRQAFVARTHLYLYLITGNQKYKNQAERYVERIKSSWITKTDGPNGLPYYFWHYHDKTYCQTFSKDNRQCSKACSYEISDTCQSNPDSWSCSGPEELSYGNYNFAIMYDLYRAGFMSGTDFNHIKNTFTEGLLVENAEVSGIPMPVMNWAVGLSGPRSDRNPFIHTAEIPHWPLLSSVDDYLKEKVFRRQIKYMITYAEDQGTTWGYPFDCVNDLRGPYGEICEGSSGDSGRSHPAYLMSMIGSYLLPYSSLTVLNENVPIQCTEGEVLTEYTCPDGTKVDWCTCLNGKEECILSPEANCPEPEPQCTDKSDCESFDEPIQCNGDWSCVSGQCIWTCDSSACQDGETTYYTCPDYSTVMWCSCVAGEWQCIAAPEDQCSSPEPREEAGMSTETILIIGAMIMIFMVLMSMMPRR